MKLVLLLSLVLILTPVAFAQENTSQNTTSSQTIPAIGIGSSTTVKSNNLCIRVGEPSTEKPSVCTQSASNVSIIPGAGGFVHYCQNNTPPWPPATSCTLQSSGCGPTSLAMILSTFGAVCEGETCTPSVVDRIMAQNGQRLADSCMSAAASGVVESRWFKNLGMETAPSVLTSGFNFAAAKRRIDEGYLIVASATNAPSCNCNHIFVIQDVDPASQSVIVRDPVCAQNNQEADFNSKYSDMIRSDRLGWLYAVPVKPIVRATGVE